MTSLLVRRADVTARSSRRRHCSLAALTSLLVRGADVTARLLRGRHCAFAAHTSTTQVRKGPFI